jgi:hypothetical protein
VCVPAKLCPTCADDEYRWQVPTAEERGAAWAASVAKRLPAQVQTLPWAFVDERVWEMARSKVRDLSLDARVVSQLALVCHFAAQRWWHQERMRIHVDIARIVELHGKASRNA